MAEDYVEGFSPLDISKDRVCSCSLSSLSTIFLHHVLVSSRGMLPLGLGAGCDVMGSPHLRTISNTSLLC